MTWVCLRVQVRQERRVASTLTEAGIQAYAPVEIRKVAVKHPHRPEIRRTVPRTTALTPSYVFVDLPHDDADQPDPCAVDIIRAIRTVHEIMANAYGKPRKVDLQRLGGLILMDAFKMFDATYEPPKRKGYSSPWELGDKVKGRAGNVDGWVGEVVGLRGHRQIEVMFERDGKQITVKVDDDNLSRAEQTQPLALVAA